MLAPFSKANPKTAACRYECQRQLVYVVSRVRAHTDAGQINTEHGPGMFFSVYPKFPIADLDRTVRQLV
jgi:hypothetical protein